MHEPENGPIPRMKRQTNITAEVEDTAQRLIVAWVRYVELFGTRPHGTIDQTRALVVLMPKGGPK